MSQDEKLKDCITRHRKLLSQLSVFGDDSKPVTTTLGDLRLMLGEIKRLEDVLFDLDMQED